MSADNGIYILQTKDGFRVIHAQAIDNLYWWHVPGAPLDQYELRNEINPAVLFSFFKKAPLYKAKYEAWHEAMIMYREIMNSIVPILEYGIQFIYGCEDWDFPTSCCNDPQVVPWEDDQKRCLNCGEYE